MEFPWDPEPIPETEEAIYRCYPGYKEAGLATFGPDRVVFSADVKPLLTKYYNTPLHPDDIWVVTQPKCGTNWTEEMVWLINNDCDFEGAKSYLLPDRWHFLEMEAIMAPKTRQMLRDAPDDNQRKKMVFSQLESRSTPWYIQTHLPLNFCPPGLLDTCKVISTVRNPMDACVSYYHMLKGNHTVAPEVGIEDFAQLYIQSKHIYLPFFSHVLQAWNSRDHPNLLLITFEEMKKDLRSVMLKVATFLGKTLTEKQLDHLAEHLDFRSMKNNPWVNKTDLKAPGGENPSNFMRKGRTGDWKNHFSPEMEQKFKSWMEENLRGTGLTFVTE